MKKILKLTILLLVALFILTGCDYYQTNEEFTEDDKLKGIVSGKYHIPSNSEIKNMTICNKSYNSVEVCTPDLWVIRIEKPSSKKDDTYYTDIVLDHETWDSISIGDRYEK